MRCALPHDGERFGEQLAEGLTALNAALELRRFGLKLVI
jgi:hypothetical protein